MKSFEFTVFSIVLLVLLLGENGGCNILVYEKPTADIPTGLATLVDEAALTWSTFGSGYLGEPFILNGIASCGKGCKIAYGEMQFWGKSSVGSMLLFNDTENNWRTIGSGVSGQIEDALVMGESVVLLGNINLIDNPNYPLGGIAKCNFYTNICSPLANGIFNYSGSGSIVQVNRTIFVGFSVNSNAPYQAFDLNVVMWDSLRSQWRQILFTELDGSTWFSVVDYENSLLAFAGFTLTNNEFMELCEPNGTIKWIAQWTGACWQAFVNNTEHLDKLSPWAIHSIANHLFLISTTGSLYIYNKGNQQFSEVQLPFSCSFRLSYTFTGDSRNAFLWCCDNPHTIARLNISARSWEILNETFCSGSSHCIMADSKPLLVEDDLLYIACDTLNTLILSTYNISSNSSNEVATVNALYNPAGLYSICSFGYNLLFFGSFTRAGNIETPQGVVLWDGNQWKNPFTFNFGIDPNLECTISGTNATSLIIAYDNPSSLLEIAVITEDLELTVTPTQVSCTPSAIAAINDSIYVACQSSFGIWIQSSQNWVTLLSNSGPFYALAVSDYNVYLAGAFVISVDGRRYVNIIKYDHKSGSWLYIEPVGVATIGQSSISSLAVGPGGSLYAGGKFIDAGGLVTHNIARCSEYGVWVDNLLGGVFPSISIPGLFYHFVSNKLYILSNTGGNFGDEPHSYELFTYDGSEYNYRVAKSPVYSISTFTNKPSVIDVLSAYSWSLLIVVGIAIIAFFGITMVVIIIVYFRQSSKKKYIEIPDFHQGAIEEKIQIITKEPGIVCINEDDIIFKEVIGSGAHSEVKKAIWNGRLVAVKSVFYIRDEFAVETFLKEIKLLSSIHHRNIVGFLGLVITDNNTKIWMIQELMDADLKSMIPHLKYREQVTACIHISAAMEYLHHGFSPAILHRDLKPQNILVNKEGIYKVADFGASRVKNEKASIIWGTPDYIAPEVILHRKFSEKSDVYSFGVVLAEVFGKNPFAHLNFEHHWEFLRKLRDGEVVPEFPECPNKQIAQLMRQCMDSDPDQRPSFVEIHSQLLKIKIK